jgi:hypothetical protein
MSCYRRRCIARIEIACWHARSRHMSSRTQRGRHARFFFSLVKTLLFPARILQATLYLCHYMNRPLHSCLHMQQFSWQRTSSRNVAAPVLHGPPPTVNRHDFNNSSSSSSISCSSKVSDTTPPCTKQAASLSCEI